MLMLMLMLMLIYKDTMYVKWEYKYVQQGLDRGERGIKGDVNDPSSHLRNHTCRFYPSIQKPPNHCLFLTQAQGLKPTNVPIQRLQSNTSMYLKFETQQLTWPPADPNTDIKKKHTYIEKIPAISIPVGITA